MTNENTERQIIELVAADRIGMPISSMSGKLKRRVEKLADEVSFPGRRYEGERVHARIQEKDRQKARTMKEAIAEFADKYPSHGKILAGIMAEKRLQKEKHLYFGMNNGCRLTSADYMAIMTDLGFGEVTAERLYGELIDVSRNLARKRDEHERSVLIGKVYD